jgi:UDP-glucose 4-epimerase
MSTVERVLVTGGCGFIGANLVRRVRDSAGWQVRVVDDLRTGRESYVPTELADVVIGDVADPDVLDPALDGVDAVVHLASQTGVQPSVEDPARDFEGNTATTFRVLDACRRRGITRVVFASSGASVGDVTPPIHENIVPRPLSPYGAGKLAGEAYVQGFAASFEMSTCALRFSNVYGPYSLHKDNAIPNFIRRCLRGERLEIFGDGSQTRDFIHVDDLCAGIVAAVSADGIAGEVFQLGTSVETSVNELARLIQEVTGAETEIDFEERRAGEVYKSHVDITKAQRLLGFQPVIELRDGLAQTAEWFAGTELRSVPD